MSKVSPLVATGESALKRRPRGEHPDIDVWLLFLRNGLDAATHTTLSNHLEACKFCRTELATVPGPPRRIFGRPCLDPDGESAIETENHATHLLRLLDNRPGVFILAGDRRSETMVNKVLALAISRRRRSRSWSSFVVGQSWVCAPSEVSGSTDLVCVLDGAWPDGNEAWLKADRLKRVILTGDVDVWKKAGVQPDIVVTKTGRSESQGQFEEQFLRATAECPLSLRAGLLASALGVDWPLRLMEGELHSFSGPVPLISTEAAPGQPSGFFSLPSPWLARGILSEKPALATGLLADFVGVPGLPEELRTRVERRIREHGVSVRQSLLR